MSQAGTSLSQPSIGAGSRRNRPKPRPYDKSRFRLYLQHSLHLHPLWRNTVFWKWRIDKELEAWDRRKAEGVPQPRTPPSFTWVPTPGHLFDSVDLCELCHHHLRARDASRRRSISRAASAESSRKVPVSNWLEQAAEESKPEVLDDANARQAFIARSLVYVMYFSMYSQADRWNLKRWLLDMCQEYKLDKVRGSLRTDCWLLLSPSHIALLACIGLRGNVQELIRCFREQGAAACSGQGQGESSTIESGCRE